MGYYIQVLNSDIKIHKENFEKCLKAIQSLKGRETIKDGGGSHFSWVSYDFYNIDNLDEMLKEWRWEPEYDREGNIVELELNGEKLGDDDILFKEMAPYIEDDCYIEFQGEGGERWKWEFMRGQMKELEGKTTYE